MADSTEDPRQAARMRRYFMALGGSAMIFALYGGSTWAGIIDARTLALAAVLILAVAGSLWVIFRRGWNLRFPDPNLSVPIIIAYLAIALTVVARAGPDHAVLLTLFPLIFLVGVFRVDGRTMLKLTAGVSVIYAAILAENTPASVPHGDTRLALLYWALLTSVLAYFSMLGGYINHLRKRLSDSKHDLEQAFRRIEHQASYDALTGVFNRRRIAEILEQERNRNLRLGTLFSVCLLDIDHFKRVNDTWGHAAGDAVLRGFAGAISALLRDADFLGRMGGEEFLAVFSGTPLDGAIIGAERMRSAVGETRFAGAPPELQVTVSAGVACHRAGETIDELLARADAALYQAKNSGRDRVISEPA